jgi:hypothetical protein
MNVHGGNQSNFKLVHEFGVYRNDLRRIRDFLF